MLTGRVKLLTWRVKSLTFGFGMVKTRSAEGKMEKGEKSEFENEENPVEIPEGAQGGSRASKGDGVSRQEFMDALGAIQSSVEKLSSQVTSSTAAARETRVKESAPPPSSAAQFSDAFRFNSTSADGRVQSSPVREASPDRFFPGYSPFSPSSVGNTNISLPFGVATLPKRSENEVAILHQIMEAASDPDRVVRLCKKRIQILYAAESLGWKGIQTYLQMFPGDPEINVSNLEAAVRMSNLMEMKSSGSVAKKPPPPESNYGASRKKGSCFNCGGSGHWANECPAPRKPKGN